MPRTPALQQPPKGCEQKFWNFLPLLSTKLFNSWFGDLVMKLAAAGVGPTAPFPLSFVALKGNSLLCLGTVAVLASNLIDAVDAKKSSGSGSGSGSKSKPKTSTKLKGLDSGSENTESSPFPTGIVVGAAIGGFALGVIVTALGFCCYSRKKSQSQPDQGVQMITVTPNHNTQGPSQYPGYLNSV